MGRHDWRMRLLILGIASVFLGSFILNIFHIIPTLMGGIGAKLYETSIYLGSVIIFLSIMISFAIFYAFGASILIESINAAFHCGNWLPCLLYVYSVALATPTYQIDTPILAIHSASIIVGYTVLFAIFFLFGLQSAEVSLIVIFIIAAIIETIVSSYTYKDKQLI